MRRKSRSLPGVSGAAINGCVSTYGSRVRMNVSGSVCTCGGMASSFAKITCTVIRGDGRVAQVLLHMAVDKGRFAARERGRLAHLKIRERPAWPRKHRWPGYCAGGACPRCPSSSAPPAASTTSNPATAQGSSDGGVRGGAPEPKSGEGDAGITRAAHAVDFSRGASSVFRALPSGSWNRVLCVFRPRNF